MDQLTTQYQQTAQKQFQYMEAVNSAFQKRCIELRDLADQAIAALDSKAANFEEQQTNIKVKLKADLDQTLQQYEAEMRKSFTKNLDELEVIYRQKEIERLADIERMILSLK